jgi:hypothetical protein
MKTHLSWYTTTILASGRQLMHVRPTIPLPGDKTVLLDEARSQLLSHVLNELARDSDIPWAIARQAVLRGFYANGQESLNRPTGLEPSARTDRTAA